MVQPVCLTGTDNPCGADRAWSGLLRLLLSLLLIPLLQLVLVPAALAAQDSLFGDDAGGRADAEPRAGNLTDLFSDAPRFLPVAEAFVLQLDPAGSSLTARWQMPDGYYLYRHAFRFSADGGAMGPVQVPAGKAKTDEYFGDVEVYYHGVDVPLPVQPEPGVPFSVTVGYQGCADAGLCYPPQTLVGHFVLQAGSLTPVAAPTAGADHATGVGAAPTTAADSSAGAGVADRGAVGAGALASVLAGDSMFWALLVFFAAGIGLAFTPCVLPMVPILSTIIIGQGPQVTRGRAFVLSLAYVLGMAVTYAGLGLLVGLFGAGLNLQAALQAPLVLVVFAGIFVALAFAMFGAWELRLPRFLQDRLDQASQNHQGGRLLSVAAMGSISSLVVSPCVSAPLAGALVYLSTTGDMLLSGGALLALGLGMGVPLVVVGVSGGQLLPKAGAWMDRVKAGFGFLLLAVAVWLLERVVPASGTLLLWGALLVGVGVWLGGLDSSARQGPALLGRSLGLFALLCAGVLVVGAASGGSDPLRPLAHFASAGGAGGQSNDPLADFQAVNDLPALERALATASQRGQPVLLDVYADWCISCKVMERSVLPEAGVRQRLGQFLLLRADVTANSAAHQALLNRFGLFGPPALVFFDRAGTELAAMRLQGEVDAAGMRQHLDSVLAAAGGTGLAQR